MASEVGMRIGYFLSSEEFSARELLRQAELAENHGFDGLWISDHFHPWTKEQGNSPFVWSVLGAIVHSTSLQIGTAVTCPTVRIHPAVIAQAAATIGSMSQGRFTLGVGSGEALNEHILGDRWPAADTRLEMLEEAVHVIREMFTGDVVSHLGDHYEVEHARLYELPEQPVPIFVSGFGPKSAELAGRIGDGFINTKPDAELIKAFRDGGGAGKPMQAGTKVCWAPTKDEGTQTAFRIWKNEALPGELAQVLPTPEHFEQASSLVTPDMIAEALATGPDPEKYVETIKKYEEAGFDELYIQQIGPDQEEFFQFFEKEVRPLL
jgi:G6PDH family F420-dependent oxidoreductase